MRQWTLWMAACWLIAARQFTMLRRSPLRVLFGFTQPLIYVVFFGPFFASVFPGRIGETTGINVLVPGLLLQLTVFSAGFSGYATLQERREGVLDTQRVSAAASSTLLIGRAIANALVTVVQALLLSVAALPFGFRFDPLGALIGLVIVFVVNVGVAAASSALAYRLVDETTFTPIVQNTTLPLVILSGVLLPLTTAPGWLQSIAFFNPFSHTVNALRAAFVGALGNTDLWWGGLVSLLLSAVLAVAAVASFARVSK